MGPLTEPEALEWVKDAMNSSRYWTHPHFEKRCRERGSTIFDARKVIETATECKKYDAPRSHAGGTSWRLIGLDVDGVKTMVGVEAFKDYLGRRVLLITIMDGPEG